MEQKCSCFPMIDTVRFCKNCRFKGFRKQNWVPPKDWTHSHQTRTKLRRVIVEDILNHKPTGLKATFTPNGTTYVEVSVPRLLFGSNTRLITQQFQLERALKEAESLLGQVATMSQSRRFTRVDLVWQVKGRIQDFIDAHRNLKHPEIRRLPAIWQGESILWAGKELSIIIYDKPKKERLNKATAIVRIEIRLKGKKLRSELGGGLVVKQLPLLDCYRAFRRKLLSFTPQRLIKANSISQVYSLAVKTGWKIHGEPAVDVLLRKYSAKRRAGIMRQIARAQLWSYGIEWGTTIPAAMPRMHFSKQNCDFTFPVLEKRQVHFAKSP